MKLLFISILSLITGLSFGQAPKHANQIIVEGVSYNQVLSALTDDGYFIDKKDNDLQTVFTVARVANQTTHTTIKNIYSTITNVVFYVRVKDSVAYISGRFNMDMDGMREYEAIQNMGGMYKAGWQAMDNFAESLKGKVDYVKN